MGQTLSEPVTEKHTSMVIRGKRFAVAVSDMQGWRISMEDAHSLHLNLPPAESHENTKSKEEMPVQPAGCTMTNYEGEDSPAFFGVFDGHGGSAVAKFTGNTIHQRLAALEAYKSGDYEKALKQLYLKTDEDLRADPNFFNDPSGCTAVSGIITLDGRIIVANSGDSRSVLGYHGEAKPLSFDHKPTNAGESARISAAGGFVEFGRVNGNLALSRAIGDFEFKQNYSLDAEHQIVTADPEITTHQLDGEEEFLVLACDGIWDCLSSQQVVDFVRRAVANGDSLTKICEDMMVKCLAPDSELGGIGCDNMTVVIVALLGGRTLEEWQAWVKSRVENKVGYDTPDRVADVFGQSNATPLAAATTGVRQAGIGGLANLQQVLQSGGIRFRAVSGDEDDTSEESEEGSNEGKGGKEATTLSTDEQVSAFIRAITGGGGGPDGENDVDMLDGDEDEAGASTNHVEEVSKPESKNVKSTGNPDVASPANLSSKAEESKDAEKVEKTVNGESSKSSS